MSLPLSSWRDLFEENDERRLSFFAQIKASKDGVVRLPTKAIIEGVKKWENCLVGWFVNEVPDYQSVISSVRKLRVMKFRVNVAKKGKLFILQFAYLK